MAGRADRWQGSFHPEQSSVIELSPATDVWVRRRSASAAMAAGSIRIRACKVGRLRQPVVLPSGTPYGDSQKVFEIQSSFE